MRNLDSSVIFKRRTPAVGDNESHTHLKIKGTDAEGQEKRSVLRFIAARNGVSAKDPDPHSALTNLE